MTTTCANHSNLAAAAFCRTCGKPLCTGCMRDVRGVVYCEECLAARLGEAMPPHAVPPLPIDPDVVASSKGLPSPTLAAFLGFIPGAGAFYNGQYQKGIVHVLMFITCIALTDRVGDFFGFLIPFSVFYFVFDAYKTAKCRVTGEPMPDPLGLNNMFGLEDFKPQQMMNGQAPANRPPVAAFVLIGLGVLFMLGDISRHIVHTYWPVALIGIGLWKGVTVWNVGRQQ